MNIARIMVVDDRIHVGTDYALRETLKGIPSAKWSPLTKTWTYPANPRSMNNICHALVGEAAGLSFEDDASKRLVEEARQIERIQSIKQQTDLPDIPGKTEAWLHQKQAFHFAKDLDGVGLFIDMGGGKSKVLVALAEHWESKMILICCPRSVMGVWEKQFRLHGLRDYDYFIANDTLPVTKKSGKIAAFVLRPTGRPKVVVCNYDIIWRKEMNEVLERCGWDLVVHDESHKIKAPGGAASKQAARFGKKSDKVVLLTGTPMPHGKEDIYAQYRAMDPEVFGSSFTRFKNRYCVMGGYQVEGRAVQIVGYQNEDEFARKMGSVAFIVSKDEIRENLRAMGMEIPDANPPIDVRGRMGSRLDRLYHKVKFEFVAELEDQWDGKGEVPMVVAENALTKLMRLRQITSGHVKDDDGVVHTIGREKEEMLYDVLEGISGSEPVIVFAAFHHDLDVIEGVAEKLGRHYGELSGRRRDALAPDSTLADGVEVAGVQLQSGGVGIDFTRSRYAIYYSLDYNLGNVLQSFARLDRPGQQYPVTFIRLILDTAVGNPSVDWITIEALDEREDMIEAVLRAAARKEL